MTVFWENAQNEVHRCRGSRLCRNAEMNLPGAAELSFHKMEYSFVFFSYAFQPRADHFCCHALDTIVHRFRLNSKMFDEEVEKSPWEISAHKMNKFRALSYLTISP